MIISHTRGFVYIKTRKTASTSLEIALSGYCGPADTITAITNDDEIARGAMGFPGPQNCVVRGPSGQPIELINHTPASVARTVLGDKWPEFFTFTIERNPYDKVVSQYYYVTRSQPDPPSMSQFLENFPAERMSNWSLYAEGDDLLVDYVGRYEAMEQSLAAISQRLGLASPVAMPEYRAKSGIRKDNRHYRDILSARDRRVVDTVCGREIEAFGYRW